MEYLAKSVSSEVCLLCGLYGTGKTTIMLHTIQKLNCYLECIYIISVNKNNFISELFLFLSELVLKSNSYYIFIDEITFAKDFVNHLDSFAECYESLGMHIVASGSDIMSLSKVDTNKYVCIATIYCSYAEYNSFKSDVSVFDYIKVKRVDYSVVIDSIYKYNLETWYTRKADFIFEIVSHNLLSKTVKYTFMNLTFSDFNEDCTNRDLCSAYKLLGMYKDSSGLYCEIIDLLKYALGIYDFYSTDKVAEYEGYLRDLFVMLNIVKLCTKYVNGEKKQSYIISQQILY